MNKYYFASANTSEGFVSFYNQIIEECERAYILKGGPGCGQEEFVLKMGKDLSESGFAVDFIFSSQNPDRVDGIVLRDINVVVVDGSAPHIIDPIYHGAVERILNFGDYVDVDYLRDNKKVIRYYTDKIRDEYKKYYEIMKYAKLIHDRLEREYEFGMNYKLADSYADEVIKEFIKGSKGKESKIKHRFAGVMTKDGQISFYENLTKDIRNRIIIKGRAGTGKSTLSRRVANEAINLGYDVEYYHCSFDPKSIDMIIIPELSLAILDGTAPHVLDPEVTDMVIDTFNCVDTNIVREDEDPIKSIQTEYRKEIERARDVLKSIYSNQLELESYYRIATDFNDVNALRIRITNTLLDMKN